MAENVTHLGGCHCGAVRFEVHAPAEVAADECNCSICHMAGYLHLIVPRSRFRLVQGEDALSTYTFNTGTARHFFCSDCGVKPFYVPRSHPEGISVNVRCIDEGTITGLRVAPFGGREWERNVGKLAPLPG